ncbi:MAG: M48 family metallopeptidase [Chloroflexi bacterium]|nr:M48 family metallopeptidase [Chloroflexota bacterium]
MKLNYSVVYSKRRTLSLIVERDGSVVVRAPLGTSDTSIRHAVEAKRLWLYEKTNHKQKYPAYVTRKEFVAGETLLYLGRNYRLDLTNDDVPGLHFNGGFTLSRRQRSNAARLVREWYIERARQKLPAKVDAFAKALGVTYGRVLISDLKVRWGSCTPKNNLNFNWRIIKAPTFVIDYVIVHELAHLLEPNHTARFWNIVSVQVPKYEEAKAWLRENGRVLEEEM